MDKDNFNAGVPLDADDASSVTPPTEERAPEVESIETHEPKAEPDEVDQEQNHIENPPDNQPDGGPRPNQPDAVEEEMYSDEEEANLNPDNTESETEEIMDMATTIYTAIWFTRPRRQLANCVNAGLAAYFANLRTVIRRSPATGICCPKCDRAMPPAVPPPSPNIDEHINEPAPEMPDVFEGNQRARHNRQDRRENGPYRQAIHNRYNGFRYGHPWRHYGEVQND